MVTGENKQIVPTENVCVADEPKYLCIVRDMVDSQNPGRKYTVNLPASLLCSQMIDEVVKLSSYNPDSIRIKHESTGLNGELQEIFLDEHTDKPLISICSQGARRQDFTISDREGVLPQKAESTPVQETSSTHGSFAPSTNDTQTYSTYSTSNSEYSSSYASAFLKSETGYVGLVNQAMTCYLNSLLQTLFMTPEFRNALYRWEFDGLEEEMVKSIPYQLQRLFLLLQTSKKKAVETTDVTKSFGWDSSEAWQQHDVQELCRVMFDALELKWRNTDQAHLINHLYQGKMKDYVKCLECGTESARIDAYLDIPLVIRPFGSNQAYGNVDEALKAFVQPETLDNTNQYFCEKCNKKCDAHKGLKFESFPYLLTLQLKRFDFDYSTMHRIKLNDRMSFPEILDLNSFTKDDPGGISSDMNQAEFSEESEHIDKLNTPSIDPEEGLKSVNHGTADGETLSKPAAASLRPPENEANGAGAGHYSNGPVESGDEGIDEGIDVGNCASGTSSVSDCSSLNSEAAANDRNTKESGPKGPYVYELFSIMIHSGNAAGGHYYAYVKSFKDGQWYAFNDQQVSRITYDDIRKTYGGSGGLKGYYSATYASSTNAYMLMYRQIDKDKNADFMQPEHFPEHLKMEMQRLKDKEEAEKRQREIDRSTCKIKLYCCHPSLLKKMDVRLEIHKDKTLAEATEMALQLFELDGLVPVECCRLVKYDDYHDSLERSFDNEEDTTMGVLLGGVKSSYTFDLLLETKRPDQVFQEYKPGGVTVKVYVVDLTGETIEPPVSVRAYHNQTVQEFQHLVSQTLGVPEEHMKCVLERYHNDLRILTMPTKSLKSEGFFRSNKVYIECSGEEDPKLPYLESKLYQLLDRHQNTIRIIINLPKKAEVEELQKGSKKHSYLNVSSQQTNSHIVVNKPNHSRLCNDDASLDIDEGIGDSEIDFKVKTIGIHSSSHSDPCVYHSCETNGDSLVHHSKVRAPSPIRFETSSASTSTSIDSAFTSSTMVQRQSGSLSDLGQEDRDSPEATEIDSCDSETGNGSNICAEFDEVASVPKVENWSVTPGEDFQAKASTSDETLTDVTYEQEMGVLVPPAPSTEDWDAEIASGSQTQHRRLSCDDEEYRKYFMATPFISPETGERSLTVYVDKRISLGSLKKELEPYVGTTAENFKVYKVYSNNQEFENTRLSENLSFLDDGKLNIKLGRALKPGEYRVKVYQLLVNEAEPSKYLIDTIFAKGMTVLQSKEMILYEIKEQCDMNISLDRCRLRKKTWKNPGTIYTDDKLYENDIPIYANWEIFLEVIDGPEEMASITQLALYVKRWRPSTLQLDPFQEIILSPQTVEELKNKISAISDIPPENVEFAKGRGTFPCEVSVLEIHTDLDWDPQATTLPVYPLYISDDGSVIFYRDKTEELGEISEDRKKEIQQKENVRMARVGTRVPYSPRKERALKIYTDEQPTTNVKFSIDLD